MRLCVGVLQNEEFDLYARRLCVENASSRILVKISLPIIIFKNVTMVPKRLCDHIEPLEAQERASLIPRSAQFLIQRLRRF